MGKPEKHIAVLAGNMQEAGRFISEKERTLSNVPDYHYIFNPGDALGHRFSDLVIVGTFWNRKDANEIYREVEIQMIKNIG